MGGENFHWQGTPLLPLYEKHIKDGKTGKEAQSLAGQERGKLLKRVVSNDKREFETQELEQVRHYRWIPNPTLEDV